MWISGIPGCGKTVLFSTVVEFLLDYSWKSALKLAIAFFYFDFNTPEKRDADNVLRSVCAQMLMKTEAIPEEIKTLYSRAYNGTTQPGRKVLKEILQCLLSCFNETYILIDALDECTRTYETLSKLPNPSKALVDKAIPSVALSQYRDVTNIYMHVASSRKDLLLDIQEIKAWDCTSLRILVTSRPEFDIDNGIRPLCTRQLCLQSKYIDPDIQYYIKRRLLHDSDLQKFPPNLKLQIESQLMSQSDGM
jgi:hypothetical protein